MMPTALIERGCTKDALIKRIVWRAGDSFEVRGGKLYVIGYVPSEDFINERPSYNWGRIPWRLPQ